jgi:DNA-binding NarL/FixJ family response regulator
MKAKATIIHSYKSSSAFLIWSYRYREGRKAILKDEGEIYSDVYTEEEVLSGIAEEKPHAVLITVSVLDESRSFIPRIRDMLPKSRILVETPMWQEDEQARAIKLGANACIANKSLNTEEAIREILKEDLSELLGLTDKEAEVMRQKRLGLYNKEIASAMNCKLPTITSHLKNIYRKLGVNNQIEALNIVFPRPWQ